MAKLWRVVVVVVVVVVMVDVEIQRIAAPESPTVFIIICGDVRVRQGRRGSLWLGNRAFQGRSRGRGRKDDQHRELLCFDYGYALY